MFQVIYDFLSQGSVLVVSNPNAVSFFIKDSTHITVDAAIFVSYHVLH